jgi:hypothetical protein
VMLACRESSPFFAPDQGRASMWVKIISQWLCYLVFIWIMIAPVVLSGRDFAEPNNQFNKK